jgi:hypothetical protein
VDVVERLRQRVREVCARRRELGVPAVDVVARKGRTIAKVFGAAQAVGARPVGRRHPRDADARPQGSFGTLAGDDFADDLMPRYERQSMRRQLAVDDVQVRAADAAGPYAQQKLPRPDPGLGNLADAQLRPDAFEKRGAHGYGGRSARTRSCGKP